MPRTADLEWDEAGSGPAILLLHAGITDRRMWEPQMAPLSESRRVIRFDARGFGQSGPIAAPYHPYDDAVAILDAAGVERATVVGASMGGLCAIDLALAHPERVSALVAVGIGPGGRVPDARLRAGWDAVSAAYEAGDVERAIDLDTAMWVQDPAIVAQVRAWNTAIFARAEDEKIVRFLHRVDVLVLDAQFDAAEYASRSGWGHSSVDDAVDLAVRAEAKKLFLFHHDPTHTDEQIDRMVQHARKLASKSGTKLEVDGAREGFKCELAGRHAQ